jgi:putative endonuclease
MKKEHNYFVYILANKKEGLTYIGMTNGLFKRVSEHKAKKDPKCFTARYNVVYLMYSENYKYVEDAISREKQLKNWKKQWKIELIEKENPTWRDLYNDMLYRYNPAIEKDPE